MVNMKFRGNRPAGSGSANQGYPRVIILSNYGGLESSMLHTDFRKNRPAGSGEEDF